MFLNTLIGFGQIFSNVNNSNTPFGNIFITIIGWVLGIVVSLFNFIFSGFISIIIYAIPDLATPLQYVGEFLTKGLSLVGFIMDLVCIPQGAVQLLFGYYAFIFSVYLITRTYRGVAGILNTVKFNKSSTSVIKLGDTYYPENGSSRYFIR